MDHPDQPLIARPKKLKPNCILEPPRDKATPYWYGRTFDIYETVENSHRKHYGREDIEDVFQVSRATAGRLLVRFGANKIGNIRVLERNKLLSGLQGILRSPRWRDEQDTTQERWRRIRELRPAGRVIRYNDPDRPPVPPMHIEDLPATIELRPGECVIKCSSTQDLMEQLIELVQLLNRNYDDVAHVLDSVNAHR